MGLGLRAKSALAILACILTVLLLSALVGWRAFRAVEENLGAAYVRNLTQYNKQRIMAPVSRELALSQRLAGSQFTRNFLQEEQNEVRRRQFFTEAEGYRKAFEDKSYFIISALSRRYYFNDAKSAFSNKPRYVLSTASEQDAWFFSSMKNTQDFNINVNVDAKLKTTKVWFNVIVKDGNRKLGLVGTGLDLSTFLNRFVVAKEAGVTPMIINSDGAIQAHPDRNLINYSSINDPGTDSSTIFRLLDGESETAATDALQKAKANSEVIPLFWADLEGRPQLFAVAFVPELDWYVVTAIDLQAARVIDAKLWLPFIAGAILLLLFLLAAITIAVNRLILTPLLNLTGSVRMMAAGDYSTKLPRAGNDELGELTRAFSAMAAQVRNYTDELEKKVEERTQELALANRQMRDAHQKIDDSIQYASLIQSAILPDNELQRVLPGCHFVLWRPRDVVGGDFYVFRADERGCLIGVVDCAGHGVAGAFMTMVAHAALEVALDVAGMYDPAELLKAMDKRLRSTVQTRPEYSSVATHMDAGLAYIDFINRRVTFAGAKVSLYWCEEEEVGEIKGNRYTLGGKHEALFENHATDLTPHRTFYLTTDGLLDQAGGEKGFGFGATRFKELMKRNAHLTLEEQRDAFAREMENYQGELAQRDDITLLSFRFNDNSEFWGGEDGPR